MRGPRDRLEEAGPLPPKRPVSHVTDQLGTLQAIQTAGTPSAHHTSTVWPLLAIPGGSLSQGT